MSKAEEQTELPNECLRSGEQDGCEGHSANGMNEERSSECRFAKLEDI